MPGFLRLLDRALLWISIVCGGLTLIFMTGFSVWNVLIMRKAFNSPIVGAEDLLILALVVIVALSIPLGARTGAHIEIEVLEAHMSAKFAKISMVAVKCLGLALLIIMAWRLWHAGQSAVRFGETTQQLLISFEPFYYLLSLSVSLYAIVLVFDIYGLLRSNHIEPLRINGGPL
ncbi:TRAP transporter small permease [Pelagimonas varians]|uniref:TRAP transporter small permease protein n=1 Tax=Pelagimonas varians TaxID=696760 RepID=A0A238JSY1_9RHOB|nr:TRAP transporter small permease [Pelagimonas varians]PYG34508.1 TRAP-type C4-dicarboxylate transport system permease small subunit [Pelagimonas varians]SMX33788.1 Tripartite ATP-independent periplasmic transporters, DctQ component [Pelagimonas varians]